MTTMRTAAGSITSENDGTDHRGRPSVLPAPLTSVNDGAA